MENLVSIIIPTLNEARHIEACLRSVAGFELPPGVYFEVLVLDGGSSDGTRDKILAVTQGDGRFSLYDNPGRIQSTALNLGIGLAKGDWIMRLDAHTYYPANYMRLCYDTAVETGADNVGGIWITNPGGDGYQAQLVQALTTHRFGVGNSGFRTKAKAGPRDTVPFGFFRRSVFDRIGFFDERLVRTQDFELNRRLVKAGGTIFLNPEIVCSYFNLPTLGAFVGKQFNRQGPYNAYMWYLAPYAFVPRHAATGCFAFFFWCCLALSAINSWVAAIFSAAMFVYLCVALAASLQQAIRYRNWRHLLFLPCGFLLFHLGHGTGMLIGVLRLLTGTAPVQKGKEPWPGAGRYRALNRKDDACETAC